MIEFLKSPNDASLSSGSESIPSGHTAAEEHCVRGLECLAEEFVNEHKKRVQRSSKSAVFQFQENRRRRRLGKPRSVDEAHESSLALAEIYKKCTSQCKSIATRWGHFDAIDAGIDPAATSSSSAIAVTRETAPSLESKEPAIDLNLTVETPVDNNASLSSLSYDGDDGEDEENDNDNEHSDDFNLPPVVDAGKAANGFDSLPDGLFNF